jgi:phosphoribosyl 1,2-cyclic phosphodiesterase
MTVQVSILGSSSSGNCTLVASETTKLLIDAGLPNRVTYRRLAAANVKPQELDGLILTHEHLDHAGSAWSISEELGIPVFAHEDTLTALKWADSKAWEVSLRSFECSQIGDIQLMPFSTLHDVPNIGLRFVLPGGVVVAYATDLGSIPPVAAAMLSGANILVLEANYDPTMLDNCSYSGALKSRIRARDGHLSNQAVAEFVHERLTPDTQVLVLAHLSSVANHPELARSRVQAALDERGLNPTLMVAEREAPTPTILY